MRLSLAFVLLVVGAVVDGATTPAHGGGKGKLPNVAPVCSSSVKAWKSQSACSTFEQGICDTVTNGETCSNLCPYLTSSTETGGCSLINQAELNEYHVPLRLGVRTTLSADGTECTQTVVVSSPVGYTGPPIRYSCGTQADGGGNSVVSAAAYCPLGYIVVQTACVMLPQDGVVVPVNAPFYVGVNGMAICLFPTAGNEGRYFGLHVVCMRVGTEQEVNGAAADVAEARPTLRDLVFGAGLGL